MRRPTGAAGALSRGPAGAPCRAHQEGLPKVWAEICSQPNQSAISGSFFGTKYWKCAESDDGNQKKSMILHRMVPSAPLWPGFQPSDGDYVLLLGSSSHVYLVFEEVTSGSEWGVLLWSPTHSNASSPMHDGKFLFKNM